MWGLEIVKSKATKEPDPETAKRIVNDACKEGLLMIAPIGYYGNVLRIAPPLVITEDQAQTALQILTRAFAGLP